MVQVLEIISKTMTSSLYQLSNTGRIWKMISVLRYLFVNILYSIKNMVYVSNFDCMAQF